MKKLFASTFLVASFIFGNQLKADWDFWAIDSGGYRAIDDTALDRILTVNSVTGEKTVRHVIEDMDGGAFRISHIDENSGNLFLKRGNYLYEYDISNDTFENIGLAWDRNYNYTIPRQSGVKRQADGSISIGLGDEKIVEKKANGEIHIGKNSLITTEEDKNGVQPLYAKDAAGKRIPINIEGSKLLINSRDVEQSINNVGALSAALTGLPTVPADTTLACGLGTGTHGGDFAFSGGCASKVNENLSINYAASMTMPGQDYAGDFEDKFSARAGFVWKLGKSTKPTLISVKAKEKMENKINSLEEKNERILSKNQKLENKVSTLLARLERLEKIALSATQTKDLATIKLP